MDGEKSFLCDVLSGVPQGAVFRPILFLICINDTSDSLSSSKHLFADNRALLCEMRYQEDSNILKNDLNVLYDWAKRWKMEFNISKCYPMTENVISYKYLGVYINLKSNGTRQSTIRLAM